MNEDSKSVGAPIKIVGRYAIYKMIARGGMATVHLGRLLGPIGFSRTVAIKRLHAQFASDPDFTTMFLDEARLAARIRHPNVVPMLDIVSTTDELFLVMDYVPGESLGRLLQAMRSKKARIPIPIAISIVTDMLHGLHAAHTATNERGEALGIVHRDVSPQNVLVGTDGQARILDFGVAKAAGRMQETREGQIKGKLSYMAPEQLLGAEIDCKTDIYAASIVLWEALTGRICAESNNEGAIITRILKSEILPPSKVLAESNVELDEPTQRLLERLDAITMRGLDRNPANRFDSARDMASALEDAIAPASMSSVSAWVEEAAGDLLKKRALLLSDIESSSTIRALSERPPALSDSSKSLLVPSDSGLHPSTSITATLSRTNAEEIQRKWSVSKTMTIVALIVVTGVLTSTFVSYATKRSGPAQPMTNAVKATAPDVVQLDIDSEPNGAVVDWNGRVLGRTPLNVSLPPGLQSFVLTKDGYRQENVVIDIAAGSAPIHRSLTLHAQKAVESAPSAASSAAGAVPGVAVTRTAPGRPTLGSGTATPAQSSQETPNRSPVDAAATSRVRVLDEETSKARVID